MLFNSYLFLLAFLPVTLVGYYLIGRHSRLFAIGWLAVASFTFYGYWNWRYIPLLVVSILFNFIVGALIMRSAGTPRGRGLLVLGVAGDLALLGYFKYADFLIGAVNQVSSASLPLLGVVLPLGISFYTFTQIAFLADAYRGQVREYRLVHYALFVTYFPHLIAGPILHHKEMMPQFDRPGDVHLRLRNLEVGFSIFAIGLAKKVLVADNLAAYAAPVFGSPNGQTLLTAWAGVLAYAFQLYFDFSGYSDMAIGLSRLFGIRLPLNFNSPYKARDISDFWRRWHMTLSRFLRDYLYIPLGGNRHGTSRRYVNLMVTMVLGGLWHGAGWGFVLWGFLHGLYLCVHHAWQALRTRFRSARAAAGLPAPLAIALTFFVVTVAWVPFRAASFADAAALLHAMFLGNGIGLPDAIVSRVPAALQSLLAHLGIGTYLGGGSVFVMSWLWIALAAVIAFAFPSTQEIMRRGAPTLQAIAAPRRNALDVRLVWHRNARWATAMALLSTAALLSMFNPSEFLYFQF